MNKIGLLAMFAGLTLGCGPGSKVASVPPVLSTTLQQADVNGVPTWAMVPNTYDPARPSPWIIYDHGFGQTITSISDAPPQSYFVQSLANAGYVVIASEYRDLACWGNTQCTDDVANVQTLWRSRLNLAPQPYVIAESMGGIVTWNAITLGKLKPLAVVGIYPTCSLADMYSQFAPTIQSAYGFNSSQQYSTATAGFDPLLTPAHTFAGFPIMMWTAYSDHGVSRSKNEDPFSVAIKAAGGNVTIHTSHGDHGDPSNFDAASVISFFSSQK